MHPPSRTVLKKTREARNRLLKTQQYYLNHKNKEKKKKRKSQHRDFRLESSYILWHKTYVMLVPTGCEK